MKQKIAIVYWTDASSHGIEQFSRKEAKEFELIKGVSCGVIVHEDKERITLAMDWFPKDDQLRHVCSYPKSGIQKIIRHEIK